jgi:hypothetical protein
MTENNKKKVRLMLGDGPDRIDIGEAELEKLPNGSIMVHMTINNPQLAKQFDMPSVVDMRGIIPAPNWKDNT